MQPGSLIRNLVMLRRVASASLPPVAQAPGAPAPQGRVQALGTSYSTPGLYGSPANPNPSKTPRVAGDIMRAIFASRDGGFGMTGGSSTDMPGGAPGQQFRGVGNQGPQFGIAFNAQADAPIVGAPGGLDGPPQLFGTPGGFYGNNDENRPKRTV